jgi:ribosome maturation factor RimP
LHSPTNEIISRSIIILRLFGGWPSRAAFFVLANTDDEHDSDAQAAAPAQIGLEARIQAIIEPTLTDLGYEIVRVAVLGRERPTVQIMADRADGSLIAVEDCEIISRAVGAVMDVNDPIPGRWTLEVSSAGIDRPLTRLKDWQRFVGHAARVELALPIDGRRRGNAVIVDATAERVVLRDGNGQYEVPMADIRRAKLLLTDELIAASAPQAAKAH